MTDAHRYEQFSRSELILRDHLAIDRTRLANDRTLLAFVHSAHATAQRHYYHSSPKRNRMAALRLRTVLLVPSLC